VDVRINETREDVFAAGVNGLGAGRRGKIGADAGDGFVFSEDIGGLASGGGDDFAVLDEQRHANGVLTGVGRKSKIFPVSRQLRGQGNERGGGR
jgi:hypothetical protein